MVCRPDREGLEPGIGGGMLLKLAPFPLGKQSRADCLKQVDTHGRAFHILFHGEMWGSAWLCGAQCASSPGGCQLHLERPSATAGAGMGHEPSLWPGWGN